MKWLSLILICSLLASCSKTEINKEQAIQNIGYGNYQRIALGPMVYEDSISGSLAFAVYDDLVIGRITERGPFGELDHHPIKSFKRIPRNSRCDFDIRSDSLVSVRSIQLKDSAKIKAKVRSDSSIFKFVAAKYVDIDDSGHFALFARCFFVGKDWTNRIRLQNKLASFQFCTFQGVSIAAYVDTVILYSITLTGASNVLYFNYMAKIDNIEGNGKLKLSCNGIRSVAEIGDVDIDQLDLPDDGTVLITFDTGIAYHKKLQGYKKLLNRYADIPDLKMIYDVENRRLQHLHDKNYFTNWLQENWNYYGYDKYLIFKNAFLIMAFFFFVNLFVYKKLIENVYEITELKAVEGAWRNSSRHKLLRWNFYFFHCLIYTAFVFWGLKLDIGRLKFKFLLASIWIIIQYIAGIICLGYIANVIISQ